MVEQAGAVHHAHAVEARRLLADEPRHHLEAAHAMRRPRVLVVPQRRRHPRGHALPQPRHLLQKRAHVPRDQALATRLVAVVRAERHDDGGRVYGRRKAIQRARLEHLAAHALVHDVEPKLGRKQRRPRERGVVHHEALRDGVSQHQEVAALLDRIDEASVAHDGAQRAAAQARQPHAHVVRVAHAGQLHDALRRRGRGVVQRKRHLVVAGSGHAHAQRTAVHLAREAVVHARGRGGSGLPREGLRRGGLPPRLACVNVLQDLPRAHRLAVKAHLQRDLGGIRRELQADACRRAAHLPVEAGVPRLAAAHGAHLVCREAPRTYPALELGLVAHGPMQKVGGVCAHEREARHLSPCHVAQPHPPAPSCLAARAHAAPASLAHRSCARGAPLLYAYSCRYLFTTPYASTSLGRLQLALAGLVDGSLVAGMPSSGSM